MSMNVGATFPPNVDSRSNVILCHLPISALPLFEKRENEMSVWGERNSLSAALKLDSSQSEFFDMRKAKPEETLPNSLSEVSFQKHSEISSHITFSKKKNVPFNKWNYVTKLLQGAQAKMGKCLKCNFYIIINSFWQLFGTIRKPCLSTFRIILPFLNSIRILTVMSW